MLPRICTLSALQTHLNTLVLTLHLGNLKLPETALTSALLDDCTVPSNILLGQRCRPKAPKVLLVGLLQDTGRFEDTSRLVSKRYGEGYLFRALIAPQSLGFKPPKANQTALGTWALMLT